ncbi:MAG: ImmA/IrrE family metallo-endopeptidase [Mycobacterium sp.]
MSADRRVTEAVNDVLALAPRHGEVSLARLVAAVGAERSRPIEVTTAELPPGVSGQWRQFAEHDEFILQEGLPAVDRTLAHELGHLVLGHDGIPVSEVARETAELAGDDLISYMLNQRTGCMGPGGEDVEQQAEDFAALLLYRLGRLRSDRSSIVQVRLGEAFG